MASTRKHYNLARAKLGVYINRMKDVRKAQSTVSRSDPASEFHAGRIQRLESAVAVARRYFDEFKRNYNAIPLPPDSGNELLSTNLIALEERLRSVYVMRTGFGKGFHFTDKQIAHALRIRVSFVEQLFLEAIAELQACFEPYAPVPVNELIAEITKLTPELITHLKRNERHLDHVTWQVYEQLVAEFFASWGYQVSLVGRNARTSADVIALRAPDSSGIAIRIFIEVKKTARRIGIDTINAVLGSIYSESLSGRIHAGVIVSSAGFQDIRKISVPGLQHLGIELRDGEDVKRWLREYSPSKSGLWLRPE